MLSNNQMNTQGKLLEISKQLSSGMKIQFASEGSTTFSESLRLDYEETTLTQAKKSSENAKKYSDNTDTTISSLTTAMDRFKTLLVQAANEIHSDTSITAIANDLEAIKNNMIALANTSVGGQYIFSGSAVSTKPISEDGKYQGNDQELQALTGSNNLLTYNITGKELFLGNDDNVSRVITTNVKHYNQELLYPSMMDDDLTVKDGEEIFITEDDSLRALLGDNNNDSSDDPLEYFYISGTKSNGTGFTEKFSLSPAYTDEDNATTVKDLLDRIGVAYGNTSTNKVVDVTLNEWGQIEIKDMTKGVSKIDFHMVSSKADVNDTDDLISSGERITEYVKSNYYSLPTATNAQAVQKDSDHRIFEIPTILKKNDNTLASPTTLLSDIFPSSVTQLVLNGDKVNSGGTIPADTVFVPIAGSTVQDLLGSIASNFSAIAAPGPYDDISVELINGRIVITDNTVAQLQSDVEDPPYDGPSTFSLNILGDDGTAAPLITPTVTFANDFSAEIDKVRFEKSGAYLSGNISQVVTSTNSYATESTRLIETASPMNIDGSFQQTLDGKVLKMDLEDVNGTKYHLEINLNAGGSTYNITDTATGTRYPPTPPVAPAIGDYPLYENYDSTTLTPADSVTYEQLMNVLEIGLNFSNLVASGSTPSDTGTVADVQAYADAITESEYSVDVSLDYKGRIVAHDKTQGESLVNLAMYDDENSNFVMPAPPATQNNFAKLAFHQNNALTIDDPHVDFFASINQAIDAVKNKIYRPDGYNGAKDYDADPRNLGIQNSITLFDHLADHVNKVHAKNGSQGNAFQYSIERNEIMIVQTKTLKSSILDADLAEVSMKYSQLTLNYQAMLSTVGKLTKLSLVNYV